jgi:hypothetical protein
VCEMAEDCDILAASEDLVDADLVARAAGQQVVEVLLEVSLEVSNGPFFFPGYDGTVALDLGVFGDVLFCQVRLAHLI